MMHIALEIKAQMTTLQGRAKMKLRMLDLLICPECRSGGALCPPRKLKLEVYSEFKADLIQENKAEVETGVLTCLVCERQYPIINGIPRMLPDNLISNLLSYHSGCQRISVTD